MKYFSNSQNPIEFNRLKRRKKSEWKFLVQGEWSESPYHKGNLAMSYCFSEKRDFCSIMTHGFPKRIVAIANEIGGRPGIEIFAFLLYRLKKYDDLYLSMADYNDDIDYAEIGKLINLEKERDK